MKQYNHVFKIASLYEHYISSQKIYYYCSPYNKRVLSIILAHLQMNAQKPSQTFILKFDGIIIDKRGPQEIINYITQNSLVLFLNRQYLQLSFNAFTCQAWNKRFPFIVSLPCFHLSIEGNGYKKILIDISKTSFSNLKFMNLTRNNIQSIQQLEFVNMPKLQTLSLSQNKITNTIPFNKCLFVFLVKIGLYENPIQQIKISRMKIGQQLERPYWGQTIYGHNSISIFAKSDFNNVTLFYKKGNDLLPRQSAILILKQKGVDFSIKQR